MPQLGVKVNCARTQAGTLASLCGQIDAGTDLCKASAAPMVPGISMLKRTPVYYQLSIVCSQNTERYTPEGIRIP